VPEMTRIGIGRGARRHLRPRHPLLERPAISRPADEGQAHQREASEADQPRAGASGLLAVAVLTLLLLFGWGGLEPTFRVLGVLTVYALPVAGVVALWWEDWPGAELRPRWSGLVDLGVVAVSGVVLALLAQAILQGADPGALFEAEVGPGRAAASPALVPLGVSVFTVFLQVTLVSEGWPLRRLGRVRGGAAALALSWVFGLALERLLVGTSSVSGEAFTGALGCVSAVQVLGWVVLRGSFVSGVESRAVRLAVGHGLTLGIGLAGCFVVSAVVTDEAAVGALAAGTVGAGLVVGMLFEAWPVKQPSARTGAVVVVVTIALGVVGLSLCAVLARPLGLPARETFGWSTYALDAVAGAVILHVGIFRRWPLSVSARAADQGAEPGGGGTDPHRAGPTELTSGRSD
jgi:hypothetical protein